MKVSFKLIKSGSGTDTWTSHLANNLRRKGIQVSLEVYPHFFQYAPHLLRLLPAADNFDIVHTNTWNGFAFKNQKPMVTTEHLVVHDTNLLPYKNTAQKFFHQNLIYAYEKKTLEAANAVVGVSQYTTDQMKKVFKTEARCILNGIDTHFFYPQPNKHKTIPETKDKIMLFYSGNMTKRKGVDLFPEIMKKLGKDYILVCASGLRHNLFQSNENIRLIGRLTQKELVNYYNQCDIFLFPSRMEGLSLTVLEAMACGAPVITTNCSSMPELIIGGKGGYLCQKDSVEDFVEKIKILAENPSLRKDMGVYNRSRVAEFFTLEKMTESYLKLYLELTTQKP